MKLMTTHRTVRSASTLVIVMLLILLQGCTAMSRPRGKSVV